MKRLASVMLVLGLAGCSSMKINNDYAQEADFSKFKTFQYKATDEATIADTDSLADQRIIAGVRREMKANGFTEASSNLREVPASVFKLIGRLEIHELMTPTYGTTSRTPREKMSAETAQATSTLASTLGSLSITTSSSREEAKRK